MKTLEKRRRMLSIVEEHFKQGETWYDLSVKYGVSEDTLQYYARKYWAPPSSDMPDFIEVSPGEGLVMEDRGFGTRVPGKGRKLSAEVVLPDKTVIRIYSHAGVR